MSNDIQWLLIGGPAHGETDWGWQEGRHHYKGAVYYKAHFKHGGAVYRVGYNGPCEEDQPSQEQMDQIPDLIASTGLAPLQAAYLRFAKD